MSTEERPIDGLSSDTRILIQARPLPEGRPLTEEQVGEVRGDYVKYARENGIFDAAVESQIGLEKGTINRMRTKQADSSEAEAVVRKLNDWMERDARQRRASMPMDYVPTNLAEQMRAIAMTAHATTAMAALVVPSGCGKTMVLEVLAERMGGAYLYCDETLTQIQFLKSVSRAVGNHRPFNSMAKGMRGIVERLVGTNRPLLLDEAHLLKRKCFPLIRSIHDQAEIAIVMAGTHEIIDRISDQANACGQLSSRCLRFNAMEHIYNAESPNPARGRAAHRPLFSREEVKAMFDRAAVCFDRDAFELVWGIACLPGHGCLRTARRVVQLVRQRYADQTIEPSMIRWALPLLFGDQGRYLIRLAERHVETCGPRAA